MEKPSILHFMTPLSNLSPFDVNMAFDAGFAVAGYTNIGLGEIPALTQDAMQSIYAMTAPEMASLKGGGMQIADVKQLSDGTVHVPHIVRHQKAFVALCKNANLVPPEFGRMTPSMMSNGMVLHPYHFATVWEAICKATGFGDWRIVMH